MNPLEDPRLFAAVRIVRVDRVSLGFEVGPDLFTPVTKTDIPVPHPPEGKKFHDVVDNWLSIDWH